jgi:glucose-induced degradation protein 4
MRWKEHSFLSKVSHIAQGSLPGLTIAGYYYVCLDRATGELSGLYHDPNDLPAQKLELQPTGTSTGFSFSSVSFA